MKNRLVLMILLCSDMCYSLESNELDSVYEKENDLRGPCICTEYFWSWFNPAFYGSSKKSVKKAFFSAVKEGNIKVVRSIIFSSIDSIRYNDTDWSVMEWNNIKTIIRIICCRPIDSIRYNDTGGSSVIYWNNMKKEALKIAIEEGKPDIVKLLLMNCKISDGDYKISIIDKLIENEHKHKDPVALAKIMKQRGVVPYFAEEKYTNYSLCRSAYMGEFIE